MQEIEVSDKELVIDQSTERPCGSSPTGNGSDLATIVSERSDFCDLRRPGYFALQQALVRRFRLPVDPCLIGCKAIPSVPRNATLRAGFRMLPPNAELRSRTQARSAVAR